jgi:hypothetical protein
MFSVDNFYSFFDSHYGWPKTKNVVWKFIPDGSKNFNDLAAFVDHDQYIQDRRTYHTANAIIMHDQEPFSPDTLNTYKDWYYDLKKHSMWQQVSATDMFYMTVPGATSWPIFCHSEKHSRDIEFVKDRGFVDCHYFWHGLIARDWFRHWKWHAELHEHVAADRRFLVYSRDYSGSRRYRIPFMNQLSVFRDDIAYDWDSNSPVVGSDYSARITTADVRRGSIHIVLETVFDQHKVHLTEKVFKPMVMRQPFFIAAGAGSLEYLKNYGFRTFDHVWDESYDLEHDHQRRMHMIVNEISKICAVPESKFKRMIEECQSVIDHNHQHFFSQKFEDIMLNELHSNVTDSKRIQEELNLSRPGGSFFYFADLVKRSGIEMSLDFRAKLKSSLDHISCRNAQQAHAIISHYRWIKNF